MTVVTKWMSDGYHFLHKCHVYSEVRIKFLASWCVLLYFWNQFLHMIY